MRRTSTVLIITCALATASAHAAGPTMRAGLWETTTTRTNPMTGEPMTSTERNCVEEEKQFEPEELMQETRECEMARSDYTGNSFDFEMQCNMQGAKSTITGNFEIGANSGTGNMDINMSMGAMEMTMKMEWESERIGDC